MSGDVTYQALKRLSWLPDRDESDNGSVIAGQEYDNVFINGGEINNVALTCDNFVFTDALGGVVLFRDDGTVGFFNGGDLSISPVGQALIAPTGDLLITSNGGNVSIVGGASGSISNFSGSFTSLTCLGNISYSTAASVSAAGTTQATATALTKDINFITTVAANSGVALPSGSAGMRIRIYNKGANTLKIYPFNGSGGTIDGGGANASVNLSVANQGADFVCSAANVWTSSLIGAASS